MDQQFVTFVKENIKDYLPDRFKNGEIKFQHILKSNNRDLLRLFIVLDDDSSIMTNKRVKTLNSVYLNEYEERYLKGESLTQLMREMAQIVSMSDLYYLNAFYDDLVDFNDYEKMKSKLAVKLCGIEESKRFLEDKPYTPFGNLAITYRVQIHADDDVVSSFVVDNSILDSWNITKEELHRDALKAQQERSKVQLVKSKDLCFIESLDNLEPLNIFDQPEKFEELEPMYTITNEQYTNGACVIVQEGVLEKLGELFSRNFYILPSSINEIILVPERKEISLKDCNKMVRNANRLTTTDEDRLSDHAMYYDRESKELSF